MASITGLIFSMHAVRRLRNGRRNAMMSAADRSWSPQVKTALDTERGIGRRKSSHYPRPTTSAGLSLLMDLPPLRPPDATAGRTVLLAFVNAQYTEDRVSQQAEVKHAALHARRHSA